MKTTIIFTITLVISLSIGSCKKDPLVKNIKTNTTDTLTVTKHCSIKRIRTYTTSNQLNYDATYYLTGNRIDSIVAISFSPSYTSKNIYTYTSQYEATVEYFNNGIKSNQTAKQFFDADYNNTRVDNFTNGSLTSSTTLDYQCN